MPTSGKKRSIDEKLVFINSEHEQSEKPRNQKEKWTETNMRRAIDTSHPSCYANYRQIV